MSAAIDQTIGRVMGGGVHPAWAPTRGGDGGTAPVVSREMRLEHARDNAEVYPTGRAVLAGLMRGGRERRAPGAGAAAGGAGSERKSAGRSSAANMRARVARGRLREAYHAIVAYWVATTDPADAAHAVRAITPDPRGGSREMMLSAAEVARLASTGQAPAPTPRRYPRSMMVGPAGREVGPDSAVEACAEYQRVVARRHDTAVGWSGPCAATMRDQALALWMAGGAAALGVRADLRSLLEPSANRRQHIRDREDEMAGLDAASVAWLAQRRVAIESPPA